MVKSVSCTVLAYNEEATLAEAVADVHRALRGRVFEILIVDDGSTDDTAAIAVELERRYRGVRLLQHGRNLGPGSAILTGIRHSRNEVVCFHPADQQVAFAQVAQLIPLLDDHDLVVAARSDRPGYSSLRLLASRVYLWMARGLFDLREFEDLNFIHLYRRELVEGMPLSSDGIFLCTEVLVRALDRGARVAQARADCLPRRSGVSGAFKAKVIAKTMREMLRFWWQRRVRSR